MMMMMMQERGKDRTEEDGTQSCEKRQVLARALVSEGSQPRRDGPLEVFRWELKELNST